MEKGIIYIDSLEKDIANIDFYALEEKKTMQKIYLKMDECLNNYKSSNKTMFFKSINNFHANIDKISNKRLEYTTVLRNVIKNYITQSNITKNMFNNFDDFNI